MSYVFKVI